MIKHLTRLGMLLLGLVLAFPAHATFQFMVIQEVFLGPPSDGTSTPLAPDDRAQYVMLRMTECAQRFVAGTSMRVEDADGNLLGSFGAFTANVANEGICPPFPPLPGGCGYPSCPAILMGTLAADNLFTFSFDKDVNGQAGRVALPRAGGRVCFVSDSQLVDCVAWGNFDCTRSGNCALPNGPRAGDTNPNSCDQNFGTPAAVGGLEFGRALVRTSFSCGAKENSTDFSLTFPQPMNNAGSNNNVDTEVDGLIDVLDCDDTPVTGASFLWPVADLQNLRIAQDKMILSYSQEVISGSGVTYDVVRGTIANLNGFTDVTSFQCNEGSGSIVDSNDPQEGEGFYYLVRASSSATCGGAGTYGPGTSPGLDGVCP